MMQDSENVGFTPEEEGAQEAVRHLPVVEAHPSFRNALRRDFSTGQFQPRPARVAEPKGQGWLIWRWVPLACAASLLVAFAFANRGADWRVMGAAGTGQAIVDGASVSLSDPSALGQALRRGARVSVPEGSTLTLLSPTMLLVQVAPGTEMTIPKPPGRWISKNFTTKVSRGEARLLTGPSFPGRKLLVGTPVGTTEVTGTLLSVVTDSSFTCVCVAEGKVMTGKSPARMKMVTAGTRMVMYADQRPSVLLPIESEHAAGLAALMSEHGVDVGR
jgi:hypothetical protein